MELKIEINEDIPCLVFEGILTIYTVSSVKDETLPYFDMHQEINLDLSGVTEFDSAGLQLILLLIREGLRRNIRLNIIGLSSAVSDAASIFHFDDQFRSKAQHVLGSEL